MTQEQLEQQARRLARRLNFHLHKLRGTNQFLLFELDENADVTFYSEGAMSINGIVEVLKNTLDALED